MGSLLILLGLGAAGLVADYVVENDDRDRAAGRLAAIVERELAAATMASR